jgi:hypothetical protein
MNADVNWSMIAGCKLARSPNSVTGGRESQLDCDGEDPLRSPEVAQLLNGELRPLEEH